MTWLWSLVDELCEYLYDKRGRGKNSGMFIEQ